MSIPTVKRMNSVLNTRALRTEKATTIARQIMEWAETGDVGRTFDMWLDEHDPNMNLDLRSYQKRVWAAMQLLDQVLEGHGAEYLERVTGPGVEYVNMGDPYTATIMYDARSQSWSVGDWGTRVEGGGFA